MGTVLSSMNGKGGVGKSVATCNLCAALAIELTRRAPKNRPAKRILAFELDPQDELADELGSTQIVDPEERQLLIGEALKTGSLRDCIVRTRYDNLDVIPCDYSAKDRELEKRFKKDRHLVLHKALSPLRKEYAYIVLDLPGTLDLVAAAAICASDFVILVVDPEKRSKHMTQETIDFAIPILHQHPGPVVPHRFFKILRNKWNENLRSTREVKRAVEAVNNPPFRTSIAMNRQIQNLRDKNHDVFSGRSTGSMKYVHRARREFERLAREIIRYDDCISEEVSEFGRAANA